MIVNMFFNGRSQLMEHTALSMLDYAPFMFTIEPELLMPSLGLGQMFHIQEALYQALHLELIF